MSGLSEDNDLTNEGGKTMDNEIPDLMSLPYSRKLQVWQF